MFFPFFSLSFTNYSMIWIRGQEYKWYSKWENCIENKNYTQENQCSSVHHKWFCSQQIILFSNESVGCTSKSVSTHFLYNRKIRKKQKECNLTKRKVNLVILLGLTNLLPKTSLNRRENSKSKLYAFIWVCDFLVTNICLVTVLMTLIYICFPFSLIPLLLLFLLLVTILNTNYSYTKPRY